MDGTKMLTSCERDDSKDTVDGGTSGRSRDFGTWRRKEKEGEGGEKQMSA